MVYSSNAMQGVPRSMQSAMPATMKYEHVGCFTEDDSSERRIEISTGQTGSALAVLSNSPYSTEHGSSVAGGSNSRTTASNNLAHVSEMAGLYDSCVVIHSEIRVDFCNDPEGDTSIPMLCGITPMTAVEWDASVANDFGDGKMVERYGTVYAVLGTHASKTLFNSIAPHKFLGRTSPLSDPELRVAAKDDGIPTEAIVWVCWVCQMQGPNTVVSGRMNYAIAQKQTVIWSEPKQHARSTGA